MTQAIIIAIIGMLGAVIGGNGLWEFLREKTGRKKPLELMVLALGRDRLLHICRGYINQGYIPEEEVECLIGLGDSYVALGGNSVVKHYYEQAIKLPKK